MRKNMKLALLLMATGLILVTAAFFITSCGDLPEAGEKDPVVTFDPNGGVTPSGFKPTVTVPKGEKVKNPGNVTAPSAPSTPADPTEEGFYEFVSGTYTAPTFGNWQLNGTDYDWNTPVTENITLVAQKKTQGTPGSSWEKKAGQDITSLGAVLSTINSAHTSLTAARKSYFLVLATGIPLNINATTAARMNSGELTISKAASSTAAEVNITSSFTTGTPAALVIGADNPTGAYVPPILTLKVIGLRGSGSEVSNSLIRIQHGGKLVLDNQSSVKNHKNSIAGGTANGVAGNGSAICVSNGGTLNTKYGSIIEDNESTGVQTNKNLVGGVYTIIYQPPASATGAPNYNTVTLDIEGGTISGNRAKENQTSDVYATEGGTFKMGGTMMIGELSINADPYKDDGDGTVFTEIEITKTLGQYADVNLSLRSTAAGSAENVKNLWNGKQVVKAPAGGTLNAADVGKFTLKAVKWSAGSQDFPANTKLTEAGLYVK